MTRIGSSAIVFLITAAVLPLAGCISPKTMDTASSSGPLISSAAAAPTDTSLPAGRGSPADPAPPDNRPPTREPVEVRGIYASGWIAGGTRRWSELLDLIERTELNALVIDVKEDGMLSYDADVPLARAVGANRKMVPDINAKLEALRARGIFPIARITVFRDQTVPKKRPDLAVQRPDGTPWRDRSGHLWLDPYNRENWDYSVDVAIDAARRGFREIQWDYVRFPSEGRSQNMRFPARKSGDTRPEAQVIADFLAYAQEKLLPYNVFISADVFGLTLSAKTDMGIGQQVLLMAPSLDTLCPMVYPSHYGRGEYGIPYPNAAAYRTVFRALKDGRKRLADSSCQIRPWLQDFSLGVRYGPKQVRAQIQAARDNGIGEFLLWNAANRYTAAALDPPQKQAPELFVADGISPAGSTPVPAHVTRY